MMESRTGDITPPERLALRTAFEALRAGVPNRAAIALLGSTEDAIEERFEAGLAQVWSAAPPPGLLVAGGFGTGKSHLLGFLRELALRQNFVVSTVSVSKETSLASPQAMFTAALRNTIVPGHTDDAMTAALAALQRRPGAVQQLEVLVSAVESGLSPVFAAILHLLRRQMAADLLRRIENFLAGGKLPGPALRQALNQAGARGVFTLTGTSEAALAQQREIFTPLLFQAAGFAGWCVLIDEVELIGRYSPLQRARAYAELGRWLGLGSGSGSGLGLDALGRLAGRHVAAVITDDFAAQVINARQDDEKLPERLRLKGEAGQADLATAAMRAIETAPVLHAPSEADLHRHGETLRRGYAAAYGWDAPALPMAERRANRTMRHHIRGWITQWDLLRVQGRATGVEHTPLAANYAESDDLTEGSPEPPPPSLDD